MASPPGDCHFPLLAVEKLQLSDVERIFNLVQTDDMDWALSRVPFDMPGDCASFLNKIDASVSRSDGMHKVAMRLRLSILLSAVHSTSPDQSAPELPRVPLSTGYRFLFEPVIYKEEMYRLQGVPVFSLWYTESSRSDNAAMNFVVVETKKGESSHGVPQALAYMGMIHKQRDDEGSVQNVIFGLSTDHDQFHFVHLDCQGKWSRLDITYSNRQQIIETFAYIHKQTSLLSMLGESSESKDRCSGSRTDHSRVSDPTLSRFQVEDSSMQESKEYDNESDKDY
ncbi:hypothetical protein N7523_003339 [Penicillium sp. IBT 18751x]|nr:hypothetical protein N7523_003339 [Penicillium sp. IBT 18751x]